MAAFQTGWRMLMAVVMALVFLPADSPVTSWEHWQPIKGIFDVGGPLTDGSLIVAGAGQLYKVDQAGNVSPFAAGPQGYGDDAGAEAYLAVSGGQSVTGAGCSFQADDVFVLRLHAPLGITRVDKVGHAAQFVTVPDVQALNGIAFDTTGRFGNRLLVSGPLNNGTAIVEIDCLGHVQFITRSAPRLEGGLAVAPSGFGSFGGDLIAPDEIGGKIFAIAPDGTVATVADSGLPTGQDIGVESVSFVPQGMSAGDEMFYADRATPNNPHPGTDSLLRRPASELAAVGVSEGDLLAATEGGATMIAVHCQTACQVLAVDTAPSTSHGEGHIVFTVSKASTPSSLPATGARPVSTPANSEPGWTVAVLLAIAGAALVVIVAARRRRRRRALVG